VTGAFCLLAAVLAGCHGYTGNSPQEVDKLIAAGRYQQALRHAESGIAASPATSQMYWDLALRKAQILENLKRREDALAWLGSLAPLRAATNRQTLLLINEQASIARDLGHYEEADRYLSAGLGVARAAGLPIWVAHLDIPLAEVLAHLGRPVEAGLALDEAAQYERDHRDASLIAYILHYRGLILLLTNRFEEAVRPLERSLQEARERKLNAFAANVMVSLAWCEYRLGNLDRALALYNEALSMAAPDDRYLCLGHMGNIFRDGNDYAKAADYYRRAADLARGKNREYYSIWLSNLAGTLCDEGKWAEAEQVNRQALEVKKTIQSAKGTPFELLNTARIEASRDRMDAAESIYHQLISAPASDPAAALEANSRLAQLYAQTGRPQEARKQFDAALAMADDRRAGLQEDENKLTYLAHLIDLNRHYLEFLAARGDSEAAFAVAESSRARLLRDRLNLAPTSTGQGHIAEYQAAARAANVTFLSYWIAPEKSYLWEITGTRFTTIPLPGESEIRTLVEHYQAGLEKDRTLDLASGARLFNLLLGKVAHTPGGRYVIVPDGPLYGLNLETLPVGGLSGALSGPGVHYWLEDATVMVTPSLDLLRTGRPGRAPNRSLLLVGDAAEWDDGFPKLPNAQREMAAVSQSFPPASRQVLSGAAASPAGYQRAHPERYGFIHFAAHATASRDAPLDSSIVLSREGDSGRLSVKDLLALHTQAELVTLSACHSAGARTYAGEGLVGLAWAFLQSGAGSVIAGLWNVSDYSSPRLMENLYAGLALGKPPAEALRAAKLELIHGGKYAHPFYWGAFQLYAGARAR
jgi:CHAT domain-containing protein